MSDEAASTTPDAPAPPTTGIATLDAALTDVAALAERPVTEHVAVFETVHSELRRPLDAPPAELGSSEPPA